MEADRQKYNNILLLSIEDLNDWIEPLGGHPQCHTPNLSRLAKSAAVFNNAFTPSPACSSARTATLFGQAPWTTGIYSNRQSWAMSFKQGARQSIVGRAKDAGWETIGAGKVFHTGSSGFDCEDWSHYIHEPMDDYAPISKIVKKQLVNPSDDFGAIPDSAPPMYDERNLCRLIKKIKRGDQQKFWAFGTYRPHLPFIVPQRFFDLIKTPIEMPPAFEGREFNPFDESELEQLPHQAQKIIRRMFGRLLHRNGEYRHFIHAYLASIAYADHMVGRLLDHIKAEGLAEETLIVFWSDHGWQLGEKLCFRKFTLWDRALHVPLFVAGAGIAPGRYTTPVSLLDIFPTLCAAMGIETPEGLDGQNLFPLFYGAPGKGHVVSMWERFARSSRESFLATSVRSETYRLIQYSDGGMELYDHSVDPFEKQNLLYGNEDWEGGNLEQIILSLQKHYPAHLERPKNRRALPKDLDTRRPIEDGRFKIT